MKKSFRAQEAEAPLYPRLLDLGALHRWGLGALGGLLLGSAACRTDPPRLAGVVMPPPDPPSMDRPDAGIREPLPLPPGEPPMPRLLPTPVTEKSAAAMSSRGRHTKKNPRSVKPPGTQRPRRVDVEGKSSKD